MPFSHRLDKKLDSTYSELNIKIFEAITMKFDIRFVKKKKILAILHYWEMTCYKMVLSDFTDLRFVLFADRLGERTS